MSTAKTPTVAILLIGNELLYGEIVDENLSFLARTLFAWGCSLKFAHVIPDELDLVVGEMKDAMQKVDWVVTTGGIGVTPDDVTRPAAARALGVPLVRHPEAEADVRSYYREHITPVRLRLADLPEGAELIRNPVNHIPTFRSGKLIVLPGVPSLVKAMFPSQREVLASTPFHVAQIDTHVGESRLAPHLEEAEQKFAGISFGSYPDIDTRPMRVRLVIRGKDEQAVEKAHAWLVAHVERLEREL